MPGDRDINELLTEGGFADPAALAIARAALEKAGLTHPGKKRISDGKLAQVKTLLDGSFGRTCVDPKCQAAVKAKKPGVTLVRVLDRHGCENCGGSDNRKSVGRLEELSRKHGIAHVVVVGGSPSVREELQELKPVGWELRLIDGTERRTGDKARADLEWAHLVLIWGSSELDHKVSRHYTDVAPQTRRKVVAIARRGIAALLAAAAEHLERLPSP